MPPVPGSSAEPAGQAAANDYDGFAEAYAAGNEVSSLKDKPPGSGFLCFMFFVLEAG